MPFVLCAGVATGTRSHAKGENHQKGRAECCGTLTQSLKTATQNNQMLEIFFFCIGTFQNQTPILLFPAIFYPKVVSRWDGVKQLNFGKQRTTRWFLKSLLFSKKDQTNWVRIICDEERNFCWILKERNVERKGTRVNRICLFFSHFGTIVFILCWLGSVGHFPSLSEMTVW